MRMLGKLLAGSVGAVTVLATLAGPALADPPSGVTPRATDIVGAGAATNQNLFDQLALDYSHAHTGSPQLYSWDAVNPATGAAGGSIVTKSGCTPITRPDDSSAAITALVSSPPDVRGIRPSATPNCMDYADSSRGRLAADPPYAPGGLAFAPVAGDAVTYATRDAASGGSNAPASLTPAQLTSIYLCQDTNWDQVGGPNAPIHAYLPQTWSDTRAFWLTELGGGSTPITPGSCVSTAGNTLKENQGVNTVLNDPDAIVPYSVADYIAQAYHSAPCFNSGCTPVSGSTCSPSGGQKAYGCDEDGFIGLDQISHWPPFRPWPCVLRPRPDGASIRPFCQPAPMIDTSFPFQEVDYAVVRYDPTTSDHISASLEGVFGAATASVPGWICASSAAAADISNYGFLTSSRCGVTS